MKKAMSGIVLEKIFGTGILTPLEETDDCFNLSVNHLNLGKYSKMIQKSDLRDDLDAMDSNYNPSRNRIIVDMPSSLSINYFDPNSEFNPSSNLISK
jgi:hypothetical protein